MRVRVLRCFIMCWVQVKYRLSNKKKIEISNTADAIGMVHG